MPIGKPSMKAPEKLISRGKKEKKSHIIPSIMDDTKIVKGFNLASADEGFGGMGRREAINYLPGEHRHGSDHDFDSPLHRLNTMIKRGLIENTTEMFEAALTTMRAKNADYSGDNTGMRNFQLSAEVSHVPMSKGILNRLMDKMTRIGNLLNKDQAAVKTESIFDTLQDAINYSAILYFGILIEQRDKLVKQQEALEAYQEEKENG
jgi:hypothetical protein